MATSKIYLDNAATTPLDERVIDAMCEVFKNNYGNPSATHSIGRTAKATLENARKTIAGLINAEAREIVFTSGGTEADNMAIRCVVNDLGIKHIITSPIEHKAVLETCKILEKEGRCNVHLVSVDEKGNVDLAELEKLASNYPKSLISLMHANNEIATLLDYKKVSEIAKANECIFHSDTVQSMGHYAFDVKEFGADLLTCSAHKLHGPKGVGFLYVNHQLKLKSMITGGGQERNHRAGTENVAGIVGLEKALQLAFDQLAAEQKQIFGLKQYAIDQLCNQIEGIQINGETSFEKALYTVLSCSVPPQSNNALLLFKLDIAGICCSGGSACNSGAASESHVLEAIKHPQDRQAIRFSFGRFSTQKDIDEAVSALKSILENQTVQL
ncbi:MAG: cysteine desulfurase [Flavobacteriales bacterium]|nr:cysteine desulfurase [Flavobacteriales bacterium]